MESNKIETNGSSHLTDGLRGISSPSSTFSNSPVSAFSPLSKTDDSDEKKSYSHNSKESEDSNSEAPTKRSKRKHRNTSQEKRCPICSELLNSEDYEAHYEMEKQGIETVAKNLRPTRKSACYKSSRSSGSRQGRDSLRWDTFKKLREKRQHRIRETLAFARKSNSNVPCPICDMSISGTLADLNEHVDQCLARRDQLSPISETDDVDIEGFDSYEWAGHSRIRIASITNEILGSSTCRYNRNQEEDDQIEVVVDGDEVDGAFGQAQYSEADIIPCLTNEPKEDSCRKEIRNALIGEQAGNSKLVISNKWSDNGESNEKSKNSREGKCLICMDEFNTPLVSTICWHVYCQECWLRTLGVKKLCPQCNSINTANDLRRIYL